jgi:hypothetical protein
MSGTVLVPQVNDGAVTHGTPGQFSKADFFHLTLISSNWKLRMLSDFIFVSIADEICALSTDEENNKKRIGIIPKKRFVLFILKQFSDLLSPNISLKHIHIEEKQI